jgi:undecaprenyl-diphosphatase
MNDTIRVLILAVIQGITEFLPISSDGHLVIGNALLKYMQGTSAANGSASEEPLTLILSLHLGTLGSIAVVYFERLKQIVKELDLWLCLRIIVATIPAGIIGITFKKTFEELFNSPMAAGMGFLVTAVLLLIGQRFLDGHFTERTMPFPIAFLIGCFQAVAILPGVSRSGCTISGGLICGVERTSCATFSFLIAIPAIAGAVLLDAVKLLKPGSTEIASTPWGLYGTGAAVSFVVGIVALKLLIRMLSQQKLHWFGYYCLLAGVLTIGWQMGLARF